MAVIKAEAQKDFELIPDETVIRVRVEEIKLTPKQGQYGEYILSNWKFNVTGVPATLPSEFVGSPIWGSCTFKLTDHPDNKLKQWTEALLGIAISEGFELDTDNLVGREARGIVGHYEKTKAGQEGRKGQSITALLPLVSGSGQTIEQAASVAAEDANLAAWQASVAPIPAATEDPWASTLDSDEPGF
jgi:hypothetical protein